MTGKREDGKAILTPIYKAGDKPVVGNGLSFPRIDDAGEQRVRYKANLIKYRELFAGEADDDEDLEEGS